MKRLFIPSIFFALVADIALIGCGNSSEKDDYTRRNEAMITLIETTPSTQECGYSYVDLGLTVDWGTCNLGAENPWQAGARYRWGELLLSDKLKKANSMVEE